MNDKTAQSMFIWVTSEPPEPSLSPSVLLPSPIGDLGTTEKGYPDKVVGTCAGIFAAVVEDSSCMFNFEGLVYRLATLAVTIVGANNGRSEAADRTMNTEIQAGLVCIDLGLYI